MIFYQSFIAATKPQVEHSIEGVQLYAMLEKKFLLIFIPLLSQTSVVDLYACLTRFLSLSLLLYVALHCFMLYTA